MSLKNLFNKKIIFFGDSITDANRLLNPKYPNGFGYVSMITDDYAINHNYANITIVNKGISGNKTSDLLNRINEDVLSENEGISYEVFFEADSSGEIMADTEHFGLHFIRGAHATWKDSCSGWDNIGKAICSSMSTKCVYYCPEYSNCEKIRGGAECQE